MGVGAVGSSTFYPYSTALNSGPTAASQTQEAASSDQATDVQDTQPNIMQVNTGNITPTRGQSLNIVV
jgi:hypothetical protein